jgi:pyruvate dehydrogenase E2 component (dihydrolipoamide acetyltransferase)
MFKHPVLMPKMSMTMETGELIAFHVKAGDEVKSGAVLFEVMTDKIDMEVEAPADGIIDSLLANPGDVVEVGKPVLLMMTKDEIMNFDFSAADSEGSNNSKVHDGLETASPATTPQSIEKLESVSIVAVKAVPKARVVAAERGIDLKQLTPSGPNQTITMSDLPPVAIDYATRERQRANKALIAKSVVATRNIPQASFHRYVRARIGQAELIAHWARVLRSCDDLETLSPIGIALIIESKYGSALPVFKDPDLMELETLKNLIATTGEAAKKGKVPVSMLSGATTTIFNLTNYAMNSTTPLLFPNQATSLTIGYESEENKNVALTIDLNRCDFYLGAALLDELLGKLK